MQMEKGRAGKEIEPSCLPSAAYGPSWKTPEKSWYPISRQLMTQQKTAVPVTKPSSLPSDLLTPELPSVTMFLTNRSLERCLTHSSCM